MDPSASGENRASRIAIQVLVAAGGCAALSWEVLWQIESSLALGVSARGTAITLAATMAGMGLGSLVAGRLLARREPASPTRLYGLLELAIGLAGLAMPAGFAALEGLDAWVYGVDPALAPGVHALSIAMLLGPPAMAMGASVPVFALIAARFGTSLSRLYAMNTAGAAIGVLFFTFAVVPALGLASTVLLIAGLNIAVCALLFVLRAPAAAPSQDPVALTGAHASTSPVPLPLALGLAFGTGFVTFGLEVAWFRSLRASFQSSADSFAIILASVLIPLAVGARLAPRLRARGVAPGALLAAAGVGILLATPLVERMDLLALQIPDTLAGLSGYAIDQFARFGLALAILGPPILLLGTVFPWLLDELSTPHQTGPLYGANTVGAAVGSLLAAWGLLPTLGFAGCAWLLGSLTIGMALAAASPRVRRPAAALGAAALALAVTTRSSVGVDRVQSRYDWSEYEILAHDEGPDSTVSVVAWKDGVYLLIDGFQASAQDAGWGDYMDRMGRLPVLVHPEPHSALVIGFGTGQTAHGVRDEGVARVDIAELDRSVLDVAHHFPANQGVLEDPAVRPFVMDGRAWLRRSGARYDVITLEPMPPHFAGVNALYSRDFYSILAERLEDGGVACQWVPLHLLPPYFAASVVRTFQEVFPDAELWVVPNAQGILLGRKPGGAGKDSHARLQLRHETPALIEETALRLGPNAASRFGAEGDVITDDNQLLAYGRLAAEARIYRGSAGLVGRNMERVRRLASQIRD